MGLVQRLIGSTTGRRGWGIYDQWPAMSRPCGALRRPSPGYGPPDVGPWLGSVPSLRPRRTSPMVVTAAPSPFCSPEEDPFLLLQSTLSCVERILQRSSGRPLRRTWIEFPYGEADLVYGSTLGGIARFCRYSRRNFARRWMVEGEGTGWAVLAQR